MAALRLQGCWPGTLSGPARQVRDWQVWALREPLRGFVLGVMVVAAAAAGLAATATRWRLSQLAVFVAFLACGVALIESTRTIREVHGSIVSIGVAAMDDSRSALAGLIEAAESALAAADRAGAVVCAAPADAAGAR